MSTQVILLERVSNLGNMGDVVSVKPGYARNYLLPEKKALRASKDNVAYFEAQKKEAEKLAKKVADIKVPLIRAASESGQLYGSVNTRDIAQAAAETSGEAITRPMVKINTNFKTIGLFPVNIQLHPEVIVEITVNIARSKEEAQIQADTGKALVSDDTPEEVQAPEVDADEALAEALEEDALEAEKERAAEAEEKAAEDAAKSEEKSAKRAEKKAAKAEDEVEETTELGAEEAPVEEAKAEDAE